jgi:hypothetical protein
LLFVDDDMGFKPDLILDMLTFNQPLVGAIYPVRGGTGWVGGPLPTGDPDTWETTGEGKFIEVDFVGTGVMLIRRDVISGILEGFPGLSDTNDYNHKSDVVANTGVTRLIRCFDQTDTPGRARLSEDFTFCLYWRMLGGKIYASIAHEIQHVGKNVHSGCYGDYIKEKD